MKTLKRFYRFRSGGKVNVKVIKSDNEWKGQVTLNLHTCEEAGENGLWISPGLAIECSVVWSWV